MKRFIIIIIIIIGLLAGILGGCASTPTPTPTPPTATAPSATATPTPATAAKPEAGHGTGEIPMKLGNFSVSLTVKDIAASRAFYEKLGFTMVAGDQSKNWVVLQNDNARIGLFQGMFDKNTLTFNPGWDSAKNTLADFQDVREIQKALQAQGLTLTVAADESTSGPAFLMLLDPDGNPILLDQHVSSPTQPTHHKK